MATIKTKYLGNLRTKSIHLQSGNEVITDAPLDNNGKGEFFSPTDLLATSLGCCMVTIMGIAANTHHISLQNVDLDITKIMESNPRRVAEVKIEMTIKGNYTEKEKKILENSALNCPVAKSLNENLKQTVSFIYV